MNSFSGCRFICLMRMVTFRTRWAAIFLGGGSVAFLCWRFYLSTEALAVARIKSMGGQAQRASLAPSLEPFDVPLLPWGHVWCVTCTTPVDKESFATLGTLA